MKLIVEGKQVGMLTYFVSSLDILEKILQTGKIAHSRIKEFNYNNNKMQYSISLSRDFDAAHIRNFKRWRYGIIINGNELSDKYEITPVSYTGVAFQKSNIRVKCLTAYDNNTFSLQFANWKSFQIPKKVFNIIKNEILHMTDLEKEKYGLVIQTEGKKLNKGRKIVEKYSFSARYGGLAITASKYPELSATISKLPTVNEFEERVWIDNSNYIDVRQYIVGVVIPENMSDEEYEYFSTYVKPIMDVKGIDFIYTY